jgi:hypothetical protein
MVGCSSREAGRDYAGSFVPAKTPSESRTGGTETELYIEFLYLGARGGNEVLIVTTNERVDVERYVNDRIPAGVRFDRRAVFVVPSDCGRVVEDVLREEGFWSWPSMEDAFLWDGVSWKIVVKTRDGSREIVVSELGDLDLSQYYRTERRQDSRAEDDAVTVHAKKVFNLVRRIRVIASENGRRLDPEVPE